MNKNQKLKAEKVKKLKNIFKDLKTAVLFKNNFLNVSSIEKFKKEIKEYNANVNVIKNRLLKRVFEDTKLADLNKFLIGPLMFIYSNEDSLNLIKKIYKFKKENKETSVVVGFYNQKKINSLELEELSKLPSYSELLRNFIGLLKSPMSNLVMTLDILINKKQKKI